MSDLAYKLILSRPLIFYLGLLTLTSLLATATIGYLIRLCENPRAISPRLDSDYKVL